MRKSCGNPIDFLAFGQPAQELLNVPEVLLFSSGIPNTATHYYRHDTYGIFPVEHLTLGAHTFGHDTTMNVTENPHLLFQNNEASGWKFNPTAVVPVGVGTAEKYLLPSLLEM